MPDDVANAWAVFSISRFGSASGAQHPANAGEECGVEVPWRDIGADPEGAAEHLGRCPVAHARSARQAPSLQHRAIRSHRPSDRRQLAYQPALADPRLALDDEEPRAAGASRLAQGGDEPLELWTTAHERGLERSVLRSCDRVRTLMRVVRHARGV